VPAAAICFMEPASRAAAVAMSEPPAEERLTYDLRLRLGGDEVEAHASVPAGPLRVADMLPILQALTDAVVDSVVRQIERQGKRISCKAGCGACCRQPVPVGEAEAAYLAELVEAMPAERQARVRDRFAQAIVRLREAGHLERFRQMPRLVDLEARRRLAIEFLRHGIPCPFLEDESCSIHPHRPLSCREYLVISPASQCAEPGLRVDRVSFPTKPSLVLYRFRDGIGEDRIRWLPLVLALEWAEQHREVTDRTFPGPRLFESFLRRLSGAASRAEGARKKG